MPQIIPATLLSLLLLSVALASPQSNFTDILPDLPPYVPPPVCFYSIYQETESYSLCKPLQPDSMINDPVSYVSWCANTNIFAKSGVSFYFLSYLCQHYTLVIAESVGLLSIHT